MAQLITASSTATSPTTGVLGPLVTVFTPPAWCTLNVAECEDTCTVAWRSQSCISTGPSNAYACAPTTTNGAPSPFQEFPYSPGLVCPSGLFTSGIATYGSAGTWTPFPTMTPGETAAVCCPSGYSPPNPQENNCVSIGFAPTNFFVVSCEDNGDSTGSTGSPAYITLPQTQTATLTAGAATATASITTFVATSWLFSANAVQLRWQSKDLSLNISSSAAAGATTPSPQLITTSPGQGITASTQQTSNPTGSPPAGLSTGAEAGIGVGIGLLAVAVLIGFLVWCLRRRKSRAESPVSPSHAPLYSDLRGSHEPGELAGRPVYELDEQRHPHEADSKAVHVAGQERQELDGGTNR